MDRPLEKRCPICGQPMYLKVWNPWEPNKYAYDCSLCDRTEFYDGDVLIGVPSEDRKP